MVEATATIRAENDAPEAAISRIYEVGYHIVPTVAEEDLEKVVGGIRDLIEKAGGSFIAEGAPTLTRLSYEIDIKEGERRTSHDRGYFGWLKFESLIPTAQALNEALKTNTNILRHIIFQTVREETRARMKAPTLREVKRTDIIKSSPRRDEEVASAAPVSEEELDKALLDITAE